MANGQRYLHRLACATVVVPALAIVPQGGVEGGCQAALKLAASSIAACTFAIAARGRREHTADEALLAAFAVLAVVGAVVTSQFFDGFAAIGCAVCLFSITRSTRVCLRGRWEVLEDAVVLAAAGTAGFALLELLGVRLPWSELRRPESTLGNRNQLAGYLTVVLPVLVGAVVRRRRAALPVTLLVVTVVVVTHCRSAYLAAAIAFASTVAAYIVHLRRGGDAVDRRGAVVVVGIVALGIVLGALRWPGLAFDASVLDSAGRVFEYESGSGHARLVQHALGLTALGREPGAWPLGFGAGSWEPVTSAHAHAFGKHAAKAWSGGVPNSDLLRILVEQGVVSLALIAVVFVRVVARVGSARPGDFLQRAAMLASIVSAGVLAAFDPQLVRPERIAVLGVLLGVGAGPSMSRVAIGRAGERLALVLVAATCVLALLRVASYVASSRMGIDAGAHDLERWEQRHALAGSLFPRSSLHERRARLLALLDRCDEADAALHRVLVVHPHYWGARVELARCFARMGRPREARAAWHDAVAVEPHVGELVAHTVPPPR